LLLSLPSLNHPAQLIVVASVYLIMAERHVLRHGTSWLQRSLLWRRLPHDNPSACDAALTPPAMAVEPAPTHPFRRLNCHKYITLIVARVRRWQPALVCQALLHRRFLLSVTDRQYAGLLAVWIIPAKRYHTRYSSDGTLITGYMSLRLCSTRRAAARRFNLFNTNTCRQRNSRFYIQDISPPQRRWCQETPPSSSMFRSLQD
jgi:hypothetical protein